MVTFATANANGTLTERLGIGLQNRVRRFESARYLQVKSLTQMGQTFFLEVLWRTLAEPLFSLLRKRALSKRGRPFFSLLRKRAHSIRLAALRDRVLAPSIRSPQYISTCV